MLTLALSLLLFIACLLSFIIWMQSITIQRSHQQFAAQFESSESKWKHNLDLMTAEYHSLVESYLRETGRTYIRPFVSDNEVAVRPPLSSFRFKSFDELQAQRGPAPTAPAPAKKVAK